MFLTRLRLRRDRGLAALAPILLPEDANARAGTAHRLMWTLFGDTADRRRDFLWREEKPGVFFVLSAREPKDANRLFEIDPPKPFAPVLAEGERLAFSLRANAVVSRGGERGVRGRRRDIVADALRDVAGKTRTEQRHSLTEDAAASWLVTQGDRAGFRLICPFSVEADEWRQVPRPHAKPVTFDTLDLSGHLVVADPTRFVSALAHGFGRAKAFGCGLMLIRRV